MNAIETEGLTKAYRTHFGRSAPPSLDKLTLTVPENQIFGFLGRNGAGKTTTIKSLCGLIRPSSGSARIFGVDVRRRKARKLIGYLPENPYFYEYLSPRETLDFYGLLAGLHAGERDAEWNKLADLLDLRDIADKRIREFSKGMRQRVGFAVAMVGSPRVLILDEPMSGLDPLGRRKIREVILYARDQGATVFFSSHVLADVQQICDRIAILNRGKLVVEGRMGDLLSRKTEEIEVVLGHIDDQTHARIAETANRSRRSEDGRHYYFATSENALSAVRTALENNGILVEYIPVRESLEDYFVRLETEAAER